MENQSSYGGRGKYFRRLPFFPLAFIFIGGAVVMWLWNAIIPVAVPFVNPLSYFQAVGLLILCRILVGGFRSPMGRPFPGDGFRNARWREKMMDMTDEEKQKFKEEWKRRCGRN